MIRRIDGTVHDNARPSGASKSRFRGKTRAALKGLANPGERLGSVARGKGPWDSEAFVMRARRTLESASDANLATAAATVTRFEIHDLAERLVQKARAAAVSILLFGRS